MDNGLADFQSRAEAFLYGRLQQGQDSLSDIIKEVTRLAAEHDDNPLKELVRAADNDRTEASPPPVPLSISSSRSTQPEVPARQQRSFNPFKRKVKEKPSASSTQRPPTSGSTSAARSAARAQESAMWMDHAADLGIIGFEDVAEEKRAQNPAAMPSSSKQGKSKSTAAVEHNCVFCAAYYSSKGTCKRHLDEMHVAKKFFLCNRCQSKFKSVPEARKHTDGCGAGVLGWSESKPPPRQTYSSEFEAKVFRTQQQYTDHLLELCAKPLGTRPTKSNHRKLHNLLDQQEMQGPVKALSLHLYRDAGAWRKVQWTQERLIEANYELEHRIPDAEMRIAHTGVQDDIGVFLERLFADGEPRRFGGSATQSISNDEFDEKGAQASDITMKEETPQPFLQPKPGPYLPERSASLSGAGNHVPEPYHGKPNGGTPAGVDSTGKRPLSYESAVRVPERMPPGPPAGFPEVYHHSPVSNHYTPEISIPANTTFDTAPLPSTMIGWPVPDQPPPYDGMPPANDSITQHTFQGPGGLTMPSPMDYYTSPIQIVPGSQYVPTQTNGPVMDMYPHPYTAVYEGVMDPFHTGEAAYPQDGSAAPWLNISEQRPIHPPLQLQDGVHQHSRHPEQGDGGGNANSATSYGLYQGGIMDSMC